MTDTTTKAAVARSPERLGALALQPAPESRPSNPNFSTGPTAKPPGWSWRELQATYVPGRSHRSGVCKAQLRQVIDTSKALLGLPDDWLCALVPGSDTGAVELALWNFLDDARGADVLAFDSFSSGWAKDAQGPLALQNVRVFEAAYGALPDLSDLDFDRDLVVTWNGTTAGTCLPNGDFIPLDRRGLVICDATSAAFALDLPYDKLDVVTWSWQKSLGGEAGHGMIALSPRAQARLEGPPAPRGLPKIFTLAKNGKINQGLFAGATINTPSMLAVADQLLCLKWAQDLGGLRALLERTEANYGAVRTHVEASSRWAFLADDPAVRSKTALCLRCVDPRFLALDALAQAQALKQMQAELARLGIAYDIGSYRDAPAGLRLWGGPTVEAADLKALMPWLDWALDRQLDKQEGDHA